MVYREGRDVWNGFRLGARLDAGGDAAFYAAEAPESFAPRLVVLVDTPSGWPPWGDPSAACRLRHPNLVQLHAADARPPRAAFVLELVPGLDLRELLEGGPLPAPVACWIAHEVCAGLAYAQGAAGPDGAPLGFTHGHVCPRVIRLGAQGEVKLGGFGVGRLKPESPSRVDALDERVLYLAPEHAAGMGEEPAGDVFLVGVVLHVLLTGSPFVLGATPAAHLAALLAERGHFSRADGRASAPVVALLARMLAADPQSRPRHAAEVRDALAAAPELGDPAFAQRDLASRVRRALGLPLG